MSIYELKQRVDELVSGMSDEELHNIQVSMTLRDEDSNLVSGILDEVTGIWAMNTDQDEPSVEMTLLGEIHYSDLTLEKEKC